MKRLVKDILAAAFGALAEIFDRLAEACEEKSKEEPVPHETNSNGHVEATLHGKEQPHGQT